VTFAPLPLDDAIRLCKQAAAANVRRWWHPTTWQCRGCMRFSPDLAHRCFAASSGNRGCPWVNALWTQERDETLDFGAR
jgi:hypothetical protein